jgi:hypothetical protein
MTKNWEKISSRKTNNFLGIKTTIYLSLGLHKGYRRSPQPSKENIQHFKRQNMKFFRLQGGFNKLYLHEA